MLAIIPARGGSKRLPGKNVMLLNGKPLIAYTIEQAMACEEITDVIVSTDDDEIAKIASEYGASIPFMRPAHLASDNTSTLEVLSYTIDRYESQTNSQISTIALLQPTSPLRSVQDISQCIKKFNESGADSVIAFTVEKHPISWHKVISTDSQIEPIEIKFHDEPLQDQTYYPNGSIYIIKKELVEIGDLYKGRSLAYIMPYERSVDIDDRDDFLYAEFLMNRNA